MNLAAGALLPIEWEAPRAVRAAFTLRAGGASVGRYAALNLGAHVGDDPEAVRENRRRVRAGLALPAEPAWLQQVHGREVVELGAGPALLPPADAAIARSPGAVCAVLVADCLPVLLAARDGSAVAAAHAGWRGLAAGVLERTVALLGVPAGGLLAWIGPGIGPAHFEVGAEVRAAFIAEDASASEAFTPNARGRLQCDLRALARRRLARLGIGRIAGGTWCTAADPVRFFSHRRDGVSGRMAALVWLGT